MAYTQHASAGVYTREIDLSERVAAVSTSIGAIVGASNKGPINTRTLITSTRDFIELYGIPDASLSFMHYSALAFLSESSQLYVTRVANGALYGGVLVTLTPSSINTTTPFTSGYVDPGISFPFGSDDLFVVYGKDPGSWNNDLSVHIYPKTWDAESNLFIFEVFQGTSQVAVEKFEATLNRGLDGYGAQTNLADQVNLRSAYVRIRQNLSNTQYLVNPAQRLIRSITGYSNTEQPLYFAGGSNGNPVQPSHVLNGWDLYEDPEEVTINILIQGGNLVYLDIDGNSVLDTSIPLRMAEICESRMDCMSVLDVPSDLQKTKDAIEYRRRTLNLDSSYAAIYSPDLYVSDSFSAKKLYVPPSGYVAAVFAKTDRLAAPWYAPAGMNRGSLNILGVREVYDQAMRDMLSSNQINSMRMIYGSGIKVWESLTMQSKASALSEINVRRLMILLEVSISTAALYSVYEPNDAILWARLRDLCNRFLEPIKRGRGIYDYVVICDETNNTVDLIASGDTVLDVYVDPALPVKRIHLNAIITKTGGIQFAVSQMQNTVATTQ